MVHVESLPAGRGWPPLVCVGSPVGLFPPSPGGTARPGSGPSHRPPAAGADRPPPPPAASCCAPSARGFGSGPSQTPASPSAVCSPPPAGSSATPRARTETGAHPSAPEEGWQQNWRQAEKETRWSLHTFRLQMCVNAWSWDCTRVFILLKELSASSRWLMSPLKLPRVESSCAPPCSRSCFLAVFNRVFNLTHTVRYKIQDTRHNEYWDILYQCSYC